MLIHLDNFQNGLERIFFVVIANWRHSWYLNNLISNYIARNIQIMWSAINIQSFLFFGIFHYTDMMFKWALTISVILIFIGTGSIGNPNVNGRIRLCCIYGLEIGQWTIQLKKSCYGPITIFQYFWKIIFNYVRWLCTKFNQLSYTPLTHFDFH